MEICSVLNYYHVGFSLPRIFEEVEEQLLWANTMVENENQRIVPT